MPNHISLRLAWHNNGWNGHICSEPKSNVYCVGQQSYPGDLIGGKRDLEWESKDEVKGCHCKTVDQIPPCVYSINAFGKEPVMADAEPPDFFYDDSEAIEFVLPPATACVWPYEAMYGEDVKLPEGSQQIYDYKKRLSNAKTFFSELSPNQSIIFYYANKSNPFSEDDNRQYVLVGVSRLHKTGEIMYYKNVSEKNRKKYADGFVWQMPVTSNYPDEGFSIPYWKYLDRPEVLQNLLYIPEITNNFKYASKHISDDDALIYVERLIEIVTYLKDDLKDTSEDWAIRKQWLNSLLNELWASRGPYPGLPSILDHLEFTELISFYKSKVANGEGKEAKDAIFNFLNDRSQNEFPDCGIPISELEAYRKRWHVKVGAEVKRKMIENVLTRIAITRQHAEYILSEYKADHGIHASAKDILDNPYLLQEQYVGEDVTDRLSFNKIDHAVLPSPDLGITPLVQKDDWKRLRALLVDELIRVTEHSFVSRDSLLEAINHKLSHYPEWKREEFNEEYISYDKVRFEEALTFRSIDDREYVYLKQVREDELLIEQTVRSMLKRQEIPFEKPFTRQRWHNELFEPDCDLAKKTLEEYERAIQGQIDTCEKLAHQPIGVIAGSAGTGKTTIIKSIINAVTHTANGKEAVCLMAPTGKAADRIRVKTEQQAYTIHKFLAEKGWLNPNFTLKKSGGRSEDQYTTYIIDESSMIDLSLMATLFRAINWNYAKRLIFVGDPNQLPPIGKGKVFFEVIEFLKDIKPEAFGKLEINVRQMENQALKKGTGILELANMFIGENIRPAMSDNATTNQFQQQKSEIESFLREVHDGGEIREDLRIVTWADEVDLEEKLIQLIEKDQVRDNPDGNGFHNPMSYQVISPYRGELYGTANLNKIIQSTFNGYNFDRKGSLGGITYFDKVIQFVNRANKKAYWSWNLAKGNSEKVDVFNGEIGKVWIHNFDKKKANWNNFRMNRFQAKFERKPDNAIEFSSDKAVEENIELGYAISVHKSQGSEFDRLYFILPKSKQTLLSTELLYTGITRAQNHLTILIESDFTPLISMRRPEKSRLALINSSVFEFKPLDDALLSIKSWYEEGKIHSTLREFMVRSKSEVIITNMLHQEGMDDFLYELPLFAKDGTFYLPDFTIQWQGKTWYWEHLGMLDVPKYKRHWDEKKAWYDRFFPGQLLTTQESSELSKTALELIQQIKIA